MLPVAVLTVAVAYLACHAEGRQCQGVIGTASAAPWRWWLDCGAAGLPRGHVSRDYRHRRDLPGRPHAVHARVPMASRRTPGSAGLVKEAMFDLANEPTPVLDRHSIGGAGGAVGGGIHVPRAAVCRSGTDPDRAAGAAVLLTSAAWSLMHMTEPLFSVALIFMMGLVLGALLVALRQPVGDDGLSWRVEFSLLPGHTRCCGAGVIAVRAARPGDGPCWWQTTRALAEQSQFIWMTLRQQRLTLRRDLFCASPIIGALIATGRWRRGGYRRLAAQLLHQSGATRPCIWKTSSVLPALRQRALAGPSDASDGQAGGGEGHTAIVWMVMDWNERGPRLYRPIGADIEPEHSFCRH